MVSMRSKKNCPSIIMNHLRNGSSVMDIRHKATKLGVSGKTQDKRGY